MLKNKYSPKILIPTHLLAYILTGLFFVFQPIQAVLAATQAEAKAITFTDFLRQFYIYLSRITFYLSFLMILLAIYVYMTSNGDAKKITKSKEYLSGAIIGLAAVALAYTFFEILNPALLNIS